MPYVLLEALSAGLPIVTTRGFLTDSVWDICGAAVLAPASSPSAFVHAAEAVLRDADERRRLGVQAAKLYAERFALERTIEILRAADD